MAGELTDKQRRAIAGLLTEPTIQCAAARAGIGERTLRRWLDATDFRAAVTEASRQRLSEAIGRLRAVAAEAVETLRAALQDDVTSNRIRAATVLLDPAVKVEVDDLAQRVVKLEAAQTAARQPERR